MARVPNFGSTTLEILRGASVLLCRRPRLETERAIAALKLGVAASRALSAVYAIKVVIVAHPVLRWLVSKILKIQPVAQ